METKTMASFRTIDLPKRFFAYIRHVGPYQGNTQLFERLFRTVTAWLMSKNLLLPEAECLSMYHDDPETIPEKNQRISVGFTVPEGTVGEGDIHIMAIPAGKYLVGSFEIEPDEYGWAWSQVQKEIERNEYIPGQIMYESYKNDPREHPKGKHLVDIVHAVY